MHDMGTFVILISSIYFIAVSVNLFGLSKPDQAGTHHITTNQTTTMRQELGILGPYFQKVTMQLFLHFDSVFFGSKHLFVSQKCIA